VNIPRLSISSIFSVSLCLGIAAGAASIAPADAFEADLDQTIDGLKEGSAYVTASPLRRAESGRVTLGLTVFGRPMQLEVAPINMFAPGATVVHVTDQGSFEEPATANTYRGVVSGALGSVVAVSLEGGIPEGLILVGDDLYLIELASRSNAAAAAGELIAFHGSAARLGLAAGPRGSSVETVTRATPLNLLEIAAVGDFEYFELWGSNATSQIASVINQVDAVYTSEIETTIQILTTMIFETAADPFSVFNSGNLFNDFKNTASEFGAWRAVQGGDLTAAGLGHLFSNKFGSTVPGGAGFGFTNVLCDASKGVGITTTRFTSLHPLLVEHEFGHNFGSPHDGEGACAGTPQNQFIMSPGATGTQFSTCSKIIMRFNRDRAACITQVAAQVCGDGVITGTEVCDDGVNNGSGDGFCLGDC